MSDGKYQGRKAKFASAYEPGEFEPEIYGAWESSGVFNPIEKDLEANNKTFSIVMPPPNANGNLHIGHGLTVALEDSLTRYYRLRGRRTWYVPGADHAGFETWVVYERALEAQGKTRFDYPREALYAQVWDFVQQQRGNMELQLRALGASCAWDDLTFTLDENVVRRVYATFEKMWKDGMVYRGEKLVNFCTKHQTAFADIEVEHEDEDGMLWEIAYPIVQAGVDTSQIDVNEESEPASAEARPASPSSRVSGAMPRRDSGSSAKSDPDSSLSELVVSTTRPETLFGDTAVAVNPNDERYASLVGKTVELPLTKREIPIIADEHADMEYGTGVVKITPAHDQNDFEVGERHELPRVTVIGFDGKMLEACGSEYAGLSTEECRKKVLKDLKEQGLLRGEKKIRHAVAHCYKCGAVIEPLLKEQWFVDTEKLAAEAMRHLEADEIKFYPESKKKVLINYLKGLKDWNISRQIPWGIPIPMFRRADSQTNLQHQFSSSQSNSQMSYRYAEYTSENSQVERTRETDAVDSATSQAEKVREFSVSGSSDSLPEWIFDTRVDLHEVEYGGVKYVRDEDTFDTWFSSAHWPIVCADWEEGRPNPFYPLNVMETGADILFAWVARMIMMGLYVTGEVPFREVYLHGLVLDEHGQKMSKSKGNVINPMDMVTKYGSDAFRLGILRGRSAGMNQAFSENSVVSGRNLCNKLWNVSRFIQGMVDEEEDEQGYTDVLTDYKTENMGEDWICRELDRCRKMLEQDMAEYRFSEAVELLHSTVWDKYADWFVESQKIYKNVPLMKWTLEMLLVMLHPFAPFVTEAIWQNLSWTEGMIIDAGWPSELSYDAISAESFERLMLVVQEIRGTLQRLPEAHKGKKYGVLYGDDALVDDNSLLVKFLARVPSVDSCEGTPRGLRLALANHEVYLDVSEKVVADYREALTEQILGVGRELDGLNARMMNPKYVERAPAALVKETRDKIKEKEALIERLKGQLEVI